MCKYIPHERKSIIRKLQNKIIKNDKLKMENLGDKRG